MSLLVVFCVVCPYVVGAYCSYKMLAKIPYLHKEDRVGVLLSVLVMVIVLIIYTKAIFC